MRWLSNHPQVNITVRQQFYFDLRKISAEKYAAQFPNCAERNCTGMVAIDGSVTYAMSPNVAERIKRELPNANFIFLVRNPVERAISKFEMQLKDEPGRVAGLTFNEAVAFALPRIKTIMERYEKTRTSPDEDIWEFVGRDSKSSGFTHSKPIFAGLYAHLLHPYLKLFPNSRFLFLSSSDMKQNPEAYGQQVLEFLGLQPRDAPIERAYELEHTEKPSEQTLAQLADFYRPYNKLFNTMAKTDIDLDKPS